MATLEIGIRIDLATGIAHFGVEEVNKRLASGARIVEIRPGGAITTEPQPTGDGSMRSTLSGCKFQVILQDDN